MGGPIADDTWKQAKELEARRNASYLVPFSDLVDKDSSDVFAP